MKKMMMDAKATLGLASHKTVDEDVEKHTKSMKKLRGALSIYKSSMEKAKYAMREVMKSITEVSRAFGEINDCEYLPASLPAFAEEFKSATHEMERDSFEKYYKNMETNVMKTFGALEAILEECTRLEHQRTKTVNEYDVYRESVDKKECEYSKKGKDLKDSKHYDEEVKKRDELKVRYEQASQAFKEKCEAMEKTRAEVNANSAREFFIATSDFLCTLETEMKKLEKLSLNLQV